MMNCTGVFGAMTPAGTLPWGSRPKSTRPEYPIVRVSEQPVGYVLRRLLDRTVKTTPASGRVLVPFSLLTTASSPLHSSSTTSRAIIQASTLSRDSESLAVGAKYIDDMH